MYRLVKIAIIFLLTFILVIDVPSIHAKTESAIIDTGLLSIRSGPGLSYEVTASLNKGDQVEVLSTSGDWLEVEFQNVTGWIASWLTLTKGDEKSDLKIVSQVNSLNVRSEPSVTSPILGQLNAGDEADLTGTEGDWAHINISGQDGWVHSDYISTISKDEMDKPDKTAANPNMFTVSVDALNVREKGDLSSNRVGLIYKDDTYNVTEVDGNWVQIELSEGKEGWVYSFHGTLSDSTSSAQSTSKVVKILSNGTNIRQAATTSSDIVLRANAGDRFDIVSEVNNWYELKLGTGETAFVANWVVSIDDEQPTVMSPFVKKSERVPGTLIGLTIVIDPGHGGKDHGTTGINGTEEKDVALLTSKLLATKLRAAGATVHLTRETDTFITLNNRVAFSHQHAADAFISVHYDSTTNSSVAGFTTYYTHDRQKELATSVNNGLSSKLTIRDRGAQPGNYLVLRENRQNAILLELGFLSNSDEERVINTDGFREQATTGIYNGLIDYF